MCAIIEHMEWKLLGTAFAAVFLAEMGDKTQLAIFALAAGAHSRLTVFLGASVALVAAAALAVVAGEAVSRLIPPIWLQRGAGLLFVVLGLVFILARPEAG